MKVGLALFAIPDIALTYPLAVRWFAGLGSVLPFKEVRRVLVNLMYREGKKERGSRESWHDSRLFDQQTAPDIDRCLPLARQRGKAGMSRQRDDPSTLADLLALFESGSAKAWEVPRVIVRGFLRAKYGKKALVSKDLEDLSQDILVRIFDRDAEVLRSAKPDTPLLPWLRGVSRNMINENLASAEDRSRRSNARPVLEELTHAGCWGHPLPGGLGRFNPDREAARGVAPFRKRQEHCANSAGLRHQLAWGEGPLAWCDQALQTEVQVRARCDRTLVRPHLGNWDAPASAKEANTELSCPGLVVASDWRVDGNQQERCAQATVPDTTMDGT